MVISTSVEKPLTVSVAPDSESNTKFVVFAVSVLGKLKSEECKKTPLTKVRIY